MRSLELAVPDGNRKPLVTRALPLALWRWVTRFPAEIILILALWVAVFAPGLNRAPLLDWDEATYAQVAHEAVTKGAYLDFSWNGAPYVKKPPLLFWLVAASFRSLGESELAARLPSVICALLTMLLIYASAYEVGGRVSGLLASIVPLGFYFFVARGGRESATDPLMLMFSTLALYATQRSRVAKRWLPIAGAAIGFAILSKGAAGIIALIVIALALVVIPEFSGVGLIGFAAVAGTAIMVAAPWYLYEAIFNPLFWKSFIGDETIRRMVTHLENETRSADYTLITLLRELYWLFPIAIVLVPTAMAHARGGLWRAMRKMHPAIRLWILWLAVAFAAACAVQTKLPWYILPALIPAALLAGSILGTAFQHNGSMQPMRILGGLIAVLMLLLQVPSRIRSISITLATERANSLPNLAIALKAHDAGLAHGAGELYFAGVELPVLVYYSGLHCTFVKPEEATQIGLGRVNQAPISMRKNDLVLVPIVGDPILVANLDDEWGLASPPPTNEQQD